MEGFSAFTEGSHHWIVRSDLATALRPLMARPFAALATSPDARPMAGGRAGPIVIRSPRENEELLVRPYARGGWLRRLGGRARVTHERPLQEIVVTMQARNAGLAVPESVGVSADCRRTGFYRWWTFESWSVIIPKARPLPECLRQDGHGAIAAVGTTLRRCMDAGLWHPDLNARNIIARLDGAWKAWVVDLDGAKLLPALTARQKLSLLKRLFRSLAKEGVLPESVTEHGFATLVNTCLGEPLEERRMIRFLASCRRAVALHRLLWRRRT